MLAQTYIEKVKFALVDKLFLLLTFFLTYLQTTEAKGQSSYFLYGASMMNGE